MFRVVVDGAVFHCVKWCEVIDLLEICFNEHNEKTVTIQKEVKNEG